MTQEPPQPPEQPDSQPDNPQPNVKQSGMGESVAPDASAANQTTEPVNQPDPQLRAASPPRVPPDRPAGYGPPSLQELVEEFKIVVKDLTINVLRATVRLLEGIIARLEAPPPLPSPTLALPGTSDPGAPMLTSAAEENWLTRLRRTTQQLSETARPIAQQALEKARPLFAKVQPYWERGWDWWAANALPKIRAALPIALNDKLTDGSLTGAIASLLTVLLITINISTAQPPPKISQVPPAQPPAIGEQGSRSQTPNSSAPSESPPEVQPPIASPPTVPPISSPAAIAPSPLSRPSDQPLVAAIQDQVTAITDQYSERLIQSVQANFRSSRLIVTLGDGWYTLSPSTQDKLSTEILKRANKLNFIKLELTDADGVLVARSPVVGNSMIILKRGVDQATAGGATG